ncbi:hypothetical protein PVAND_007603 [Polypedilum vanderplanki]|uniref:Sodium/potassium-transporting ATPase subunit beta-1-interacting protein n=1 Tax=Polypedilum vanderplanki TaxID=319348 RepID=A0A9J6C8B5_POLVA|nr:hypothetical protein PVAND_007603 [Polypedilum vanderplanki]
MCTRRFFLLFVCSLQMLTIIERQIFDFLGYMFAPILANFLHIIFIIFGLFGAYQYRGKYLASYSLWNVLWIGWNAFLICFYLNVGTLDRNSDILNLGTGSVSWFETNGPGCKPIFSTNITLEDPFRPVRPDRVDNCFLDYWIIEIIHSGVQIFLTLLGLIGAICIGCILWDDDDSFEFMGNDIKSPQHTSVHPMYVSYTSIPTGSASSTQINPKKEPNQFGVVLTSLNKPNNTNSLSLSSTYIKNHSNMPSSLNNIAKLHQTQSPTHFQLIDHRQLSSSSNLSQYNSRNNLISKSASTQQIIKRNPSFNNSGSNRSEIRYTEIISTTDDILGRDERDVDTSSNRSYFMPSSQASTAAASPITSSKLMATNLQQQQLISRNFGIQNPLNHLIHGDNDGIKVNKDVDMNGHQPSTPQQQQSPLSTRSYSPTARHDYNPNKHLSNQINPMTKGYNNHHPPHVPPHQISSSPDKYACITRSPNLNHMPRRRPLPPIPQEPPLYAPASLPQSPINNSIGAAAAAGTGMNFCDQIREKPTPTRYNLKQFMPEYNGQNPLPALPPHMIQHQMLQQQQYQMYRVRSQDRISNRLKRQSGASLAGAYQHENQRPRSFCNNMINYQDYKDMQ